MLDKLKFLMMIFGKASGFAIIFVSFILSGCAEGESGKMPSTIINTDMLTAAFTEDKLLSVAAFGDECALTFIAANNGITPASDKGYHFKIESEASSLISKLARGEYDVAVLPLFEFLENRSRGNNLTLFFVTGYSQGAHALISYKPSLDSFSDLKGKKVAAVKGSSEHKLALFMAQLNSITTDSINWHYVKTSAQADQLAQKGSVDAACVRVSTMHRETLSAPTFLATTSDSKRLIPYVAIAHEKTLAARNEQILSIISEVLSGNTAFAKSPKKVGATLVNEGYDESKAESISSNFFPASVKENRMLLGVADKTFLSIDTYTELTALLPEPFYARGSKSLIGLYNLLALDSLDSRTQRIYPSNRLGMNGQSPHANKQRLFSVAIPFASSSDTEVSSTQLQQLNKARALSMIFPRSKVVVSYTPARNESERYYVEGRVENTYRKILKDKIIDSNLVSLDYSTLSRIYNKSYTGSFAETPTVRLDFLSR